MKKIIKVLSTFAFLGLISACAPEVGSQDWCDDLEQKPKGDWTGNEAVDYTKHCLITNRDEE